MGGDTSRTGARQTAVALCLAVGLTWLLLATAPSTQAQEYPTFDELEHFEKIVVIAGVPDRARRALVESEPLVEYAEPEYFDPFAGPIPPDEGGERPDGIGLRFDYAYLATYTPDQIAGLRGGALACGEDHIYCQEPTFQLDTPLPTTWLVSTFFLDRPVDLAGPDFTDISLVVHDARLGPVAPSRPQLPGGDPLGDGNRYAGINDPPGPAEPFVVTSYWNPASAQWTRTRSHAFGYFDENLFQLWWPTETELFTFDGQRAYTGVAGGGQFAPGTTSFASFPGIPAGWTTVPDGFDGLPLLQSDGTFAPGRAPEPAPTAAPTATPAATASPTPTPIPSATPTPVPTPEASAEPTPSPTPSSGGGDVPLLPLVGLVVGTILAIVGFGLVIRARGANQAPGQAVPGTPAIELATATGGDFLAAASRGPCDDLADALAKANRDCEEARDAARRARAEADEQTTAAAKVRADAQEATRAREDAQRELDVELEAPDEGTSSVSSGGLTLTERDLRLLEEARQELAARYDPQLAAATSHAQREAITETYRQEVLDLEKAETVEELRRRAARERDARIEAARAKLAAAQSAEQAALKAASDAEQQAQRARGAAHAAEQHAEYVCKQAAVLQQAYDECLGRERSAAAGGATAGGGGAGEGPGDSGGAGAGGGSVPGGGGSVPGGGGSVPGGGGSVPGGGGSVPGGGAPGGTNPGGGGGGTEVPPPGGSQPRPRQCADGTEEWRFVGSKDFRLLPQDARIEWAAFPMPIEFGQWLEPRQTDDEGNRVEGPTSISQRSMRMVKDDLGSLFSSLDHQRASMGTRYEQQLVITVPFVVRSLRKERRFVCQDGTWVATEQCRVVELAVTPKPFAYGRGRKDVTGVVVKSIYQDAMRGIEDAAEQQRLMGHYERECP